MKIEDELRKCFKCGMCRAVCPVLAEELLETAGPRAKVALCEGILDGSLSLTQPVLTLLRMCTGCRSCSLNCTSGTDPRGLAVTMASGSGSMFARTGLPDGRASRVLLEASVDPGKDLSSFLNASAEKCNEVAYFIGCAEAAHLEGVPSNVLDMLRRLGVEVAVPDEQVCCGWPQVLLGDLESAKELALRNSAVFAPFKTVLTSCIHCRSMFTGDYPSLFGIHDLAGKTSGVLEFLEQSRLLESLKIGHKTGRPFYSHPCRMGRGRAKSFSHIQFLEERLDGSLIEPRRDLCCGAPLELHCPETARKMLERKIAQIERSGCDVVLADCPFCVLAMESICQIPVKHLLAVVAV
jgi:glycolate oxidase iron-sulfur subunit